MKTEASEISVRLERVVINPANIDIHNIFLKKSHVFKENNNFFQDKNNLVMGDINFGWTKFSPPRLTQGMSILVASFASICRNTAHCEALGRVHCAPVTEGGRANDLLPQIWWQFS